MDDSIERNKQSSLKKNHEQLRNAVQESLQKQQSVVRVMSPDKDATLDVIGNELEQLGVSYYAAEMGEEIDDDVEIEGDVLVLDQEAPPGAMNQDNPLQEIQRIQSLMANLSKLDAQTEHIMTVREAGHFQIQQM